MKRREFIQKTGLAATATTILPYILPSGRLFAQQKAQKAGHVVLVIFGGGVRVQESVLKRYLADSQDIDIEGNILINMLEGEQPDSKVVYGYNTEVQDGNLPGSLTYKKVLNESLQKQGTLFQEVISTNPGHYGGLVSMLEGNSLTSQGLRQKPLLPTVFEYLRKHGGFKATDTWLIGHTIANSIPLLNHSSHEAYGAKYGANFYAPGTTFGSEGIAAYGSAKTYHPEEELPHIYGLKNFLDDYYTNVGGALLNLNNTADEKIAIRQFMENIYTSGNRPTSVLGCATQVMQTFKPKLTVVDFSTGVDGAHGNFTGYLRAMHSADKNIGELWNTIQSIPGMQGDTVMMVTPECGRNLNPNPIQDENDWYGFDHSDANTRRVFNLMVGPGVETDRIKGSEGNPVGYSVDTVPTIADVFGLKEEIYNQGYLHGSARSLFDRV